MYIGVLYYVLRVNFGIVDMDSCILYNNTGIKSERDNFIIVFLVDLVGIVECSTITG